MKYKIYPTEYIQELNQNRGVSGRKKSRAFMEYWNDKEHNMNNSTRFYAKSWGVSTSTSHAWCKDFKYQRERLLAYLKLKGINKKDLCDEH